MSWRMGLEPTTTAEAGQSVHLGGARWRTKARARRPSSPGCAGPQELAIKKRKRLTAEQRAAGLTSAVRRLQVMLARSRAAKDDSTGNRP